MEESRRGLTFDFHGAGVRLDTSSPELAESLRRDFSWFVRDEVRAPRSNGAPHVTLRAHLARPPWDALPDGRCVMVQPTCVVYEHEGVRWVDYQGRALCRFDAAREEGELWSEDWDLLYEVAYLFVLSRVGELHDRAGIHRIHALGLSVRGKGVVCMLPSGGGKTTLGLHAMRRDGVKLLSDDTPLVTRSGELLAFPNRVGCVGKPSGVDERHLRTFSRRAHGDKWLIDVEAFEDRVAESAAPRVVIVGTRHLAGPPRLERIPKREAAGELFRSVVVGLGLPQVVEFFLRFDPADMARKAAIVASRSLAATALTARADTYRIHLGRDRAANAQLLFGLLDSL